MRLFALLFSLYLACLSCLPCADEVAVCVEQAQTCIRAGSPAGSGHNLGDWCSPLCQCHCCGGVIVPVALGAQADYLQVVEWATSPRHGRLVVAASTRALGAVWQPPQA